MKKSKKLRAVFYGILLCFVSIKLYTKTHKFTNLDLEEAKQFSDVAIVDTKTLAIPGFPKAYNPSIIAYGEGYLLSFRVDSYNLTTKFKKLFNHRTSFFAVSKLNANFEPMGEGQIIEVSSFDPQVRSAPQDVRLVKLSDRIFIFFNDYVKPERRSQHMYMAELIEQQGVFSLKEPPKLLTYAEASHKIEKNWTPFVYQNRLLLIYEIQPYTLLEVDITSGLCQKIQIADSSFWQWVYGELRGGTPAELLDDQYLCFFHSCKKGPPSFFSKKNSRVFYMGAFVFQNCPPFSITKASMQPIATQGDYLQKNPKKIKYPGGLVLDEKYVYVAWGKNDTQICITTFDKEKLLASLVRFKPADLADTLSEK